MKRAKCLAAILGLPAVLAVLVGGCAEEPQVHELSPPVVIRGDPSCEECEIVLEEVAVLGHPTDSASFRYDSPNLQCVVGRLSNGEFVSSGLVGGEMLFVYDASGRAVRSIGRGGEGPGELGVDLSVIVGAGDTLYVVDHRRRQISTFDPLGIWQRSFSVPWRFDAVARLGDGSFILQRRVDYRRDDGDVGMVRVLDRMGDEIAAHDPPSDRLFELMMPDLDGRNVAPGVSGSNWTTRIWSYELHRWSRPGVRDLVVVRDAEWFRPNPPASIEEVDAWHVDVPSPRRLLHVWEESDGLLWTYSVIPDERWRPGVRPDAWDIGWATATRDTRIEVLDLNGGGRVLAEERVDEPLMPVCGSGMMTMVRETPAGDTRTVVLRPRLAGASEYRGSPSG